jgi:hypothetical protein
MAPVLWPGLFAGCIQSSYQRRHQGQCIFGGDVSPNNGILNALGPVEFCWLRRLYFGRYCLLVASSCCDSEGISACSFPMAAPAPTVAFSKPWNQWSFVGDVACTLPDLFAGCIQSSYQQRHQHQFLEFTGNGVRTRFVLVANSLRTSDGSIPFVAIPTPWKLPSLLVMETVPCQFHFDCAA